MQVFRFFLPEMAHGSSDHRNLDGIYADVFGGLLRKKSLGEILFKMLLRKKSLEEILFKMLLRKKYFRVVGSKLNIDFWTV